MVYMALPSDWMFSTGRSPQASAAPAATGMPWPIAPPVMLSQSCLRPRRVAPSMYIPQVVPSSDTMAPSGRVAATAAAALEASIGPEGRLSTGASPALAGSVSLLMIEASSARAPGASVPGSARVWIVQPWGASRPGLPG